MRKIEKAFLLLLLALIAFAVVACTRFTVTLPDGTAVEQTGAPLVTRKDGFTVSHQWLDAENVLHETRVERNTDENANAQLEALRLAFQMGQRAAMTAP